MPNRKTGLSKKQAQIFRFPVSEYDALICDGSIRSGKTTFMTIAFVDDAMRRFNKRLFGICGQTVDSAIKNIVNPFLASGVAEKVMHCKVKWNRSMKILTLTKGSISNVFEVFGGKDESSFRTIQGRTLAGVLLDEVALMPKSFVSNALQRCSVSGSKYWFSCNPASQLHWFYKEWICQLRKHNAMHLHFTLDDNPALSDAIKERYERDYTGIFHDRYIKGLWVSADGLIYDMFDSAKHVVHEIPETEGHYFVSVDFGIQNATVFLLWRKIRNSDKFKNAWLCIREWYYSGRENKKQKTVSELVISLKNWLENIKPKWIFIDPSASALIEECRRNGFTVRKGNNAVIDGITDVSNMLCNNRLVFSDICKNTIQEFGVYVWDEKAALHGEDAPLKENDHAMDSIRYFVKTMNLAFTHEYSTSDIQNVFRR